MPLLRKGTRERSNVSTSLFTQPIVGPAVMEEDQRRRAAAIVVAKDVLGSNAYPDSMVQLAEYILSGFGAFRLTSEALHELERPEELRQPGMRLPVAYDDTPEMPMTMGQINTSASAVAR